jgi:hypothetical protein
MPPYSAPYLLTFSQIGSADAAYLSIPDSAVPPLPFAICRVFWTYFTPDNILHGRHAHRATEHVLLAVAGRIIVTTESIAGSLQVFCLDSPHVGLYIPPSVWHTMQYSLGAVQLALVSQAFSEEDYLRNYSEFKGAQ